MKSRQPNRGKIWIATCLVALGLAAQAGTLLLDFGPTAVSGTDATLDLGHFAGGVPATLVSWNTVVNADNSALVYADGTAATGVSLVVGRSPAGVTNAVDFTKKQVSSSALGSTLNVGIYTNTSPSRDGIFATGTATVSTNVLGLRVDGLAAGTYTLYISGRNTSTGFNAAQQFFATNGPSGTTFTFASATTPSAVAANTAVTPGAGNPSQAPAITGTFAYGDNGVLLVVNLSAGDSLYLAATGVATNEFRGFLNAVEIVSGGPVLTNFPATIGTQPAGFTAYQGAKIALNNVKYGGYPPLTYQWFFNTAPITGATNSTLTISNATAENAGSYNVAVANAVATNFSSNAIVTIVPLYDTAQMTNIWSLLPGDRFYVTATNNNNFERGLAYDPVSGDLLLVAQYPTNNVVVLNAADGTEKYFMNLSGVTAGAAGANLVGVADDGAVYLANVTANAALPNYTIWRWADDGPTTTPTEMFAGDPGFFGPTGLRWGDNLAIRGAGTDTQILTAPGVNTNFVCLFTMDPSGAFFNPNLITITNVAPNSAFAQFGITFGPGTNTFWVKTVNQPLYLVQFDLASGYGAVIYTASNNLVPANFRMIAMDKNQKWLAGVMTLNAQLVDNVRLYDISAYTNSGPVLADQELYATANHSSFLSGAGTGATVFGGNYLFALDSNNGIKAFLIDTNTILPPFRILNVTSLPGAKVALTWQSVSGHSYQVQTRTNLFSGSWGDLGGTVPASGIQTSTTNSLAQPVQFFRVTGH
ncbi:MAG TPA: immunoglobulin domain-containing protein [Verrucomicrobiae bacterium]